MGKLVEVPMGELVKHGKVGELTQFDPKATKKKNLKADALIDYAKNIKDWPLLEQAVAVKIEEQRQFVEWWHKEVTPHRGARSDLLSEQIKSHMEKAKDETGISALQVSKWHKRLQQPKRYAELLYGAAYRKAMGIADPREARRKEWAPMLEGQFRLIYADPPWQYDFSQSERREIENQYPTKTAEEIADLKVPAANDSVLFLWGTNPKLVEALFVMKAWGFTYKTNAVWDKEIIGMGYYFRQQHELLLVGTRGSPPPPLPEVRPSSVIRSRRARHSEKPEDAYIALESMYPELHENEKVELFQRKSRTGWSGWGNQV